MTKWKLIKRCPKGSEGEIEDLDLEGDFVLAEELEGLFETGDGKYTDTWTLINEKGDVYSVYARYKDLRIRKVTR